jgi:hypothetical protein
MKNISHEIIFISYHRKINSCVIKKKIDIKIFISSVIKKFSHQIETVTCQGKNISSVIKVISCVIFFI